MKIHELIHILNDYDPEIDVLISSDQEGNGFSKAISVELARMRDDSEDEIEIGIPELDADYRDAGYTEEDLFDGPLCVVIWP